MVFMEQMAHVVDPSILNLPENKKISKKYGTRLKKLKKNCEMKQLSTAG